jgi:uncharacterized protein YlxW (UPF0749 family)
VKKMNVQLDDDLIAAGIVSLDGMGLVLALEDSTVPVPCGGSDADYIVTGQDIRTVVDALWQAGAEAIAVNGERITAVTAITDIGGSILVNYAYLAPPYQVTAIGPEGLYERLTAVPSFAELVRTRADGFGISIGFAEPGKVVVPAYAGAVTLREARPTATPAPTASGGS